MAAKWWIGAILLLLAGAAQATPKIEHWVLDNGARVYFVRAKELPLLQLRLAFDAGSSRDPADRSGVAAYTGRMLNFGAANLDADAIAAGFENLGAEFGTGVDRDMATVDLRSLSDRKLLQPALDLFATIIAEPTFPQDALERERARGLVGLQRDAQQPNVIAEKTFLRTLYGAHPYANEPVGTEASLKALTRDDLVAHHRRYYTGANAWLAIVGDATVGEAKEIARRVLGRLPRGEAVPPLSAPAALKVPARQQIAFPASQSHIRLGQPAIARTDPDYFPLLVGNYTLGGGGLVSRLADEIREKRGFAYSVYSYFYPLRVAGPFVLGLQTKNAQRDEALKVVRKVLADYVANGPTPKELDAAKKHLTGSFPLRLDSNRKIADQLSVIAFYGLPLTYLDDFIPKVEAVTIEQIRDAFKRHIDPERLATVIVGGAP